MDFATIFIIAGIVLLEILFLIARLAIRWAISLTMVGAIIIALVGGGLVWWRSNHLATKPTRKDQRPVPTMRASSY